MSQEITFVCCNCGKTFRVTAPSSGSTMIGPKSGWTTHGFTSQTGRIDKQVTVYTCSDACRKIAFSTSDRAPQTVKEALLWLEGK